MLRSVVVVVASLPALLALGCPGPVESDPCGLSTTVPTAADVVDGSGTATRSDGEAFDVVGDWKPNGASSSLVLGTLAFALVADAEGSAVDTLIADGAFPICVPLADREANQSAANLVQGGFVTDATHTGALSLLGNDGGQLAGRFAVDLVNPAGETLSFTDGVFRVPER
jgi:hypothetical protein